MDMRILKSEKRLCTCCMEEHEVKTVLFELRKQAANVPEMSLEEINEEIVAVRIERKR